MNYIVRRFISLLCWSRDVNLSARINNKIHEHGSPTNNDDSTICMLVSITCNIFHWWRKIKNWTLFKCGIFRLIVTVLHIVKTMLTYQKVLKRICTVYNLVIKCVRIQRKGMLICLFCMINNYSLKRILFRIYRNILLYSLTYMFIVFS